MNSKLIGVVLGSVLALNAGLTFAADDKKTEPAMSPAMVEQIDLANKLIALGDARKDPLLLLAAAKLQKNMGAEAAGAPTQSTATTDVLARAKKLSAGRKDMAGIADDISAQKSKGWSIDVVSGKSNYR